MAYNFPKSCTTFENTLFMHTPILNLVQTTNYNLEQKVSLFAKVSGTIVTIIIETLANDDEL